MSRDLFPILLGYQFGKEAVAAKQYGCCFAVVGIPWGVIKPHERQAQANHGQSLRRLAERGGLSASEALAVLHDQPWKSVPDGEAHARLADFILRANGRSVTSE